MASQGTDYGCKRCLDIGSLVFHRVDQRFNNTKKAQCEAGKNRRTS